MEALNRLIDRIKTSQSSESMIAEITEIIKLFVKDSKIKNTIDAQFWLKKIGGTIRQECPNAFPILNILNRAITILKDPSNQTAQPEPRNEQRLFRLMSDIRNPRDSKEEPLGHAFVELLEELSTFETINEDIVSLACEHLEEGEVILVYSQSNLMKEFLQEAVEKKKVRPLVVVSDLGTNVPADPRVQNITYISEQSIFSLISKVSKVFMDCHAVMADGAIINASGTFSAVTIANEYSVPVIVLSPMYRFTPIYTFTQEHYNEIVPPQTIFLQAFSLSNLEVIVPRYDVINSDCVSFIITQLGEFSNSYIYQAFAEYYSESDNGYEF